jgi:hypothetical protein
LSAAGSTGADTTGPGTGAAAGSGSGLVAAGGTGAAVVAPRRGTSSQAASPTANVATINRWVMAGFMASFRFPGLVREPRRQRIAAGVPARIAAAGGPVVVG